MNTRRADADTKSLPAYPENYWKLIVFTFSMGWTIIWIYRSILAPLYPEIQETIGDQSNAALGLIASAYFFGYTALQIPSGLLVDKFGQKRVLVPGFTVFALGVLSIALADSINMIYLGAAMAGIGCGTYYGAAFSLTTMHVPAEKKGFMTAVVNSGSALGLILGMSASSLLVKSMGMPWQTMVFISAGLITFLVGWFVVVIKEPSKHRFEGPVAAASEEHHEKASMRSLFAPRLVTLYLLYFTTCYAYYMIVTWLPNFLETERDISGGLVGLITSLIAVTAVPGALFFANMSDKRRDNKQSVIIFLEISAFILIAVAMFAPNAIILSVILLAYGFLGKMAVDPVLISFISDTANRRSLATTLGMFNFFGMSSSVVAPALTGWVIDSTGSGEWGFYIGAILLLVGTVVFIANEARERGKVSTLRTA